jgi:phage major head subunit gpT-like protein
MPLTAVDTSTLQAIYENVRALFLDIYNRTAPAYQEFAMEVPSTTQQETYTWLGAFPTLQEWVSERTIQRIAAFEYTVVNKNYEATISIDMNDIEDDRIGVYRPMIELAAQTARNHPADLAFQLFQQNPTGYDGQPLFSANHQEGASGTQSNIITGTGTSLTNLIDDLDAASARFASLKNDRGQPITIAGQHLDVTHVMVPPALKGAFETIAFANMIQNTTNKWANRIKVIVNPYLTDNNDWFALCLQYPFKPILVQMRRPPAPSGFNDSVTENERFWRRRMVIGIDGRYAVAPAFWQTAIKVVNT